MDMKSQCIYLAMGESVREQVYAGLVEPEENRAGFEAGHATPNMVPWRLREWQKWEGFTKIFPPVSSEAGHKGIIWLSSEA
jgi:hypothetical protein